MVDDKNDHKMEDVEMKDNHEETSVASSSPCTSTLQQQYSQRILNSRIPQIWNQFLEKLNRIDQLEKRVDEHVKRSRRRVQNILDQIPSFRRSHVRMFVTHQFEKYSGIWTLVIEGKLLIGNLDHDSADKVDKEGVMSSRVDNIDDDEKHQQQQEDEGTSNKNNPPVAATDRKQEYRIGNEEEDPVQPIVFTHLFDKVEVTFRTIYQPKSASNLSANLAGSGISPVKKSRSAKRKASAAGQQDHVQEVDPTALQASAPTHLVWNKYKNALAASVSSESTPDAHAFYVKYNNHFSERPPPPNMKFHSIVADIKLYPCRPLVSTNEQDPKAAPLYQIVSTNMVEHLFGGKFGMLESETNKSNESDEGEESSLDGQPSPTKKIKVDGVLSTVAGEDTTGSVIPIHNDIHVPLFLSYNEIIMTIFQYIQDKGLHDPADKSLIVCDKVLTDIFGVESMSFGQIWQLMLEKQLIKLVGSPESPPGEGSSYEKDPPQPVLPVTLTYVMNEQTTSSQLPTDFQEVLGEEETSRQGDQQIKARRAAMMMPNPTDDPSHNPSLLSFDMDVAIPSLFNYRARELLRNVKRREFEYTTCRTKARYLLVASKGNEETVKNKIEQAISGQGFVADNIPVFLALARAAHPNSETRSNSQIDARTCDLMERLEESYGQVEASWRAVKAVHNLPQVKKA
jgi:hypothetical protein